MNIIKHTYTNHYFIFFTLHDVYANILNVDAKAK